ncbi:hypothetical protein [Streptomyces sp. A30]|uniref:hypothetical protein n=1 Tax=Streptomyces sp. A30 TaxID=2789273 RepID=UPI00397F0D3A
MPTTYLRWGNDELSLLIAHDPAGPVRLPAVGTTSGLPDPEREREPGVGARVARAALPIV